MCMHLSDSFNVCYIELEIFHIMAVVETYTCSHCKLLTDYLLCHDDQLESRRVAFIFYLVPDWTVQDGGL